MSERQPLPGIQRQVPSQGEGFRRFKPFIRPTYKLSEQELTAAWEFQRMATNAGVQTLAEEAGNLRDIQSLRD